MRVKMRDRKNMIEQLEDSLYLKTQGFKVSIEVFPGGQQDGLDYGPDLVEIVALDTDGATVACALLADQPTADNQKREYERW